MEEYTAVIENTEADIERHEKIERLIQVRQHALEIQDRLMAADIAVVKSAEKDLERLRDQFYDENQNMMTPHQHEAAKKDFGYFLTMVEMAIGYYLSPTCNKDTEP